jgi:hypothetical protein
MGEIVILGVNTLEDGQIPGGLRKWPGQEIWPNLTKYEK